MIAAAGRVRRPAASRLPFVARGSGDGCSSTSPTQGEPDEAAHVLIADLRPGLTPEPDPPAVLLRGTGNKPRRSRFTPTHVGKTASRQPKGHNHSSPPRTWGRQADQFVVRL